ncbi:MAG: carbohydrate porin [Steroidobacter sp.]
MLADAASADEMCGDCDARDALAVDATYTGEFWRQASGGLATGSRYLDNLDVTFDVDGERLAGVEGLQLFAYLLYNNGRGFCDELTGTAQCVSNIEATEALRLYELWSEWRFGSGGQSLRFGLYDLNSEFDSIERAGLFINPSHGIGADLAQTGENGPSIFPVTSLGARFSKSLGQWSVQVAALDAVPGDVNHPNRTAIRLSSEEGALLIGETNYRWESARFGVGYWQYTEQFERLDESASKINAGMYAIAEGTVLTADSGNVDLFVRAGTADARINPIHRYYGGGAVYTQHEHQLGLAVGIAEFGESYRRLEPVDAREYIVELTYRVTVSDWLAIQPDVQYIRHPGANPQLAAGWAVGLRFEVGSHWGWAGAHSR